MCDKRPSFRGGCGTFDAMNLEFSGYNRKVELHGGKGIMSSSPFPIGGYFELDLPSRGSHFHGRAYRFHSARQALECLLIARRYKAIFIPRYICDSVVETIHKVGIKTEYYSLDDSLEPRELPSRIPVQTALLLVNYFGLKSRHVNQLSRQYSRVIVDNSQAFFSLQINSADTIYSPRKFLGVSDGWYLISDIKCKMDYPQAISADRIGAMAKRLESGPEVGYPDYEVAEKALQHAPIQRMSPLTERLLSKINYNRAQRKRYVNFRYLANAFKGMNRFAWTNRDAAEGPLCYPLWIDGGKTIKQSLFAERIYVPTYWTEVNKRVQADSVEHRFVEDLLCLPVDQRYGVADMRRIMSVITRAMGSV